MTLNPFRSATLAATLAFGASLAAPALAQDRLLNVSYDIGRELFEALNPVFAAQYQADTGRTITVEQSHGGSSRQARAILEGLNADLVAFNQETDIETLVQGGLINADWREAFPNNAAPYYSLPAFVVREGNPLNVRDWDDLVRDDVAPIFANPRTAGNARYTYITAYAYELNRSGGDDAAALEFVRQILDSVPVFDTGARGSSTSFAENGQGDVLITFEAEAARIAAQYPGLQVVTPATSLQADFPVAVVNVNAERNGSTEIATTYLNWLYSPAAQRVMAEQGFRVVDPEIAAEFASSLPPVELLQVDEVLGGWANIATFHFGDGGTLDQVFDN